MQTYLTQHIAKQVSDNLNAKFEVGRVDIVFFNRLLLRDIHIEDQQGDTLLKAERLLATVHYLNRTNRNISFNQIIIQSASINLRTDADSVLNLQFIADALASEDTTKTRWNFTINSVNIKDSRLTYKRFSPQTKDHGINFHDIEIDRLNLLVNKINTTADSVNFSISYLNFMEKSGFSLDHFASVNSISASGIEVNDLRILTPDSRLDLDHFNMNFSGSDAFNDFVNLVTLDSKFNSSLIGFRDILYFAPGMKDLDLEIVMSGEVTGRINNLKGSGVYINGYRETSMLANFNMIGLPDFSDTFIFLDLYNFTSSVPDIMEIVRPGSNEAGYDIPAGLYGLGQLSYRGKFTGFIDDFVAYGELTTELGSLVTDLSLKPGADNILDFNGRLRAVHFDAGPLAGTDQIGRITFNAGVSGQISANSGIFADLNGVIDSLQFYGYTYRQVQLEGELAERRFKGSAYINDPNIILEFLGIIDLTKEVPEFDFSANVSGARLYDLKLKDEDPGLIVSFYSTANFRGNNIDNLNGRISLVNASFIRGDEQFKIDNVSLEATGIDEHREIILNSNLADARIAGNYQFATITGSLNKLINNYIPSYRAGTGQSQEPEGNSFSFDIHLKQTEGFTGFFTPGIYIASGSRLEGKFDPSAYNSEINGSTEELRIQNHLFQNLNLSGRSDDSVFYINSVADRVLISDNFELKNINIYSEILNDSISFSAEWDNKANINYKGNLLASAKFDRVPGKRIPIAGIHILPSSITVADSVWNVKRSSIRIDSTSYEIHDFGLEMAGQGFNINGKLSEDPGDSLHLEFQNMDLRNIELITSLSNFHVSGIITGHASLSDIHRNPVIKTDIGIKEMFLNYQDFGDLSISSQWNNANRTIDIHAFSDRGPDRIINIEGRYLPEGGKVDFDLELNKINLHTFDGYLDEVFANLRGIASGGLKLEGSIRQPLFNGKLLLQETSFMVDYLKTQYNFTSEIIISNNDIVFNDLLVYDINHNICRANGRVTSNYFRDFALNIYLYPEQFMAMNTMERDNNMFYGRVIASGLVHISGPTNNIMMNISARTNRNTQFFIPLDKSSEAGEFHFLNFTGNQPGDDGGDIDPGIRSYEVDLTGIQLNFDLDITPDAEVQIIFDSKIGDIIRGRGNGSFKMEINTLGQFNMFGEYTIEQGDYLFTLQNVINKRFDIERGGRIIWNGDPFDANIDLNAVYRLRAPLNNLFPYETSELYSRRYPVECHITMKDKLMTPAIGFNIEVPTTDPDTRQRVQGILNTEEKRNRQFLSLLIINNFLPPQDMASSGTGSTLGMSASDASITTVSEFFSNQLSNWLSHLSRDVDFGVNWRPGDEITPDEVEVALSTQLLNDRVSINGHVDVGGRQTSASNIVGDFDVDIKLNRSGKLRLKAFTRANDNLVRPHLSPYTQGIGLFYREEFDNFDELMSRYWNRIFATKEEEE